MIDGAPDERGVYALWARALEICLEPSDRTCSWNTKRSSSDYLAATASLMEKVQPHSSCCSGDLSLAGDGSSPPIDCVN
jgi:hypothetical protein